MSNRLRGRHDIVVRFFARICRNEDHSNCYQKLVKLLALKFEEKPSVFLYGYNGTFNGNLLKLAHCVYECVPASCTVLRQTIFF